MIVDISHLNDAGIHDVFRHTTKPFVASHSNARALAPHPRNLTDDMIRSLSERGGVMGINYYAPFLSHMEPGEQKTATMEEMVSHMKHIKKVGGIQCIGLGSDFDGIDCPVEMKDPSELPKLEAAMRRAGFTEREIEAVFYENVLRVYREVLG
jgi:membrane dipeptidase